MLEFSTWHNLHLAFNGLPWAIGGTDCVLPCRAVTDCTWWCLLLTIFIFRCYTTYSELLPAWESGFCLWFLTCVSPLCNWHGWLGVTYPVSCQLGITVHDNHMGYIYIFKSILYIYLNCHEILYSTSEVSGLGCGRLWARDAFNRDGVHGLRPTLSVQGWLCVETYVECARVCWGKSVLKPKLCVQEWA